MWQMRGGQISHTHFLARSPTPPCLYSQLYCAVPGKDQKPLSLSAAIGKGGEPAPSPITGSMGKEGGLPKLLHLFFSHTLE